MSQQIPQPPPPKSFRKIRRKRLLSFLALIIIAVVLFYVVVTPYIAPSIAPSIIDADPDKDGLTNEQEEQIGTNPLSPDTDNDGLSDGVEMNTHHTNPLIADTDGDGLADKWEIDYGFAPTYSYDASEDPDYDGLTNLQEYQLGTITKDGVLSYQKDLFVEIDCMSGYEPSTTVINYLVSYYHELNIDVHVTVDDKISWSQLTAIGVSPDSLTSYECSLIERNFHDNSTTHVYVFYAKAVGDPGESEPLGWASGFGAFINKELVNANEGLKVLWLTDRVRTERVILLHEIGHCINIIDWTSEHHENYCSNWGCIMAGADEWWDIFGGISQMAALFTNTPTYCNHHKSLINLRQKWSVDESWIP